MWRLRLIDWRCVNMKRIGKILKSRLVVVGLAILLQVLWWALFLGRLTR